MYNYTDKQLKTKNISYPCLIRMVRCRGQKITHAGFIVSRESLLNSITIAYDDIFGERYYFDIKKLELTRDVNKALQVSIDSYNRNLQHYIECDDLELREILGLNTNASFIFYYKNNEDSSETSLEFIPISTAQTLESIQDELDRDYPAPRKTISKAIRQQVYDKFNGHCAYCGREIDLKEMQVDHVISYMGNKGVDSVDNYFPACRLCNQAKNDDTIEEFRDYIEKDAPRIHWKKNRHYNLAIADKIVRAYNLKQTNNKVVFYFERQKEEK